MAQPGPMAAWRVPVSGEACPGARASACFSPKWCRLGAGRGVSVLSVCQGARQPLKVSLETLRCILKTNMANRGRARVRACPPHPPLHPLPAERMREHILPQPACRAPVCARYHSPPRRAPVCAHCHSPAPFGCRAFEGSERSAQVPSPHRGHACSAQPRGPRRAAAWWPGPTWGSCGGSTGGTPCSRSASGASC